MASSSNTSAGSPASSTLHQDLQKYLEGMEARIVAQVQARVEEQSQKPCEINLDELAEKLAPKIIPLLRKEWLEVSVTSDSSTQTPHEWLAHSLKGTKPNPSSPLKKASPSSGPVWCTHDEDGQVLDRPLPLYVPEAYSRRVRSRYRVQVEVLRRKLKGLDITNHSPVPSKRRYTPAGVARETFWDLMDRASSMTVLKSESDDGASQQSRIFSPRNSLCSSRTENSPLLLSTTPAKLSTEVGNGEELLEQHTFPLLPGFSPADHSASNDLAQPTPAGQVHDAFDLSGMTSALAEAARDTGCLEKEVEQPEEMTGVQATRSEILVPSSAPVGAEAGHSEAEPAQPMQLDMEDDSREEYKMQVERPEQVHSDAFPSNPLHGNHIPFAGTPFFPAPTSSPSDTNGTHGGLCAFETKMKDCTADGAVGEQAGVPNTNSTASNPSVDAAQQQNTTPPPHSPPPHHHQRPHLPNLPEQDDFSRAASFPDHSIPRSRPSPTPPTPNLPAPGQEYTEENLAHLLTQAHKRVSETQDQVRAIFAPMFELPSREAKALQQMTTHFRRHACFGKNTKGFKRAIVRVQNFLDDPRTWLAEYIVWVSREALEADGLVAQSMELSYINGNTRKGYIRTLFSAIARANFDLMVQVNPNGCMTWSEMIQLAQDEERKFFDERATRNNLPLYREKMEELNALWGDKGMAKEVVAKRLADQGMITADDGDDRVPADEAGSVRIAAHKRKGDEARLKDEKSGGQNAKRIRD